MEPAETSSVIPTHSNPQDDVAIVGMACRTAGGVKSPEDLWKLLLGRECASGEIPKHRWDAWKRRDVRNTGVLKDTISKGYFINNLEMFDAASFGISPKEAEQMDPHQRMGLELTAEALENAGFDTQRLSGSDTAVYMGVDSDDFSRLVLEDLPNIEPWMGVGTAPHGLPNRISYHWNLHGPSAAVDAACASSLVAVHLGRQSILAGESKIAIVGGVQVDIAPALFMVLQKSGVLSPDGICRSFDDEANGYGRGEGGAVIILKQLSRALADGDNVLAVLKGSAVAQDGKTNGIMAPSSHSQQRVARQALSCANIDPLTIGFVEAHATSTSLGDPTELSSLAAVYGSAAGRPLASPVLIGSVKPNVGHLEAGAGAVGLVKAVLAVNKGQIPPQALLQKLNARFDWEASGLQAVRDLTLFPSLGSLRRAAVCSYGYGGTVSNVVIEQSPVAAHLHPACQDDSDEEPTILAFSSVQATRLSHNVAAQASWFSSQRAAGVSLKILANTLVQRRPQLKHRLAFVAKSRDEATELLESFVSDPRLSDDRVHRGKILGAEGDKARQVVWLFSGHGSHWKGMGKALLLHSEFSEVVASLDEILQEEAGWSAVHALQADEFDPPERVQVLMYLVQVGLAHILSAKGLHPDAVIGHSLGELAASVVAGCITAEEGLRIVSQRADLFKKAEISGKMALVLLPFDQVAAELTDRDDLVAAVDASPLSCVVSGESTAVERYIHSLEERNVKTFLVQTSIPFHSPLIKKISEPLYESLLGTIHPKEAHSRVYSTSNADSRTTRLRDADYWVNNMQSPVLLQNAISDAFDDGYRVFLEVSSHPIILQSLRETLMAKGLDDSEFAVAGTMRRDQDIATSLQSALAQLYTAGVNLDFEALIGPRSWWCPDVPATPWVHNSPHWKHVEARPLGPGILHDPEHHTLLGQRMMLPDSDIAVFTSHLDSNTKPYPGSHLLEDSEIIPAAVYLNTFQKATCCRILSKIRISAPISLHTEPHKIQVIVRDNSVKVVSFQDKGHSEGQESCIPHASCRWRRKSVDDKGIVEAERFDLGAARKRINERLHDNFAIDYLSKIGVKGMAFPWAVKAHYRSGNEMLAWIDADPTIDASAGTTESWAPHLDAACAVGPVILSQNPKLRLVSEIDTARFYSDDPPPKSVWLHIQEASDLQGPTAHITILTETGDVLVRLQSLRLSDVSPSPTPDAIAQNLAYRLEWIPTALSETPRPLTQVLVVSTDEALRENYAEHFRGNRVTVKHLSTATHMEQVAGIRSFLRQEGSTIIFAPETVPCTDRLFEAVHEMVWELKLLVNILCRADSGTRCKLFVVTDGTFVGQAVTGLAHGTLYGLCRIIASEHPDFWGGLIDTDRSSTLPIMPMKYVVGESVVRLIDGVPRKAIIRPFSKHQHKLSAANTTLLPRPEGTYIITGGLGSLGLETCRFLVENGARRVVLISRKCLPPRSAWDSFSAEPTKEFKAQMTMIQELESMGATIFTFSMDISAPNAADTLREKLNALQLPPVLGVVHAAGVLEDSFVVNTSKESFGRVMAPKISGALALHQVFPPKSLDFFILYSSIGQLVGTPGQGSYAAGNAFLDALATYRRCRGDNSVAFQFTAWKEVGMASAHGSVQLEFREKGVGPITNEEAFRAWKQVGQYDVDQAVITRIRTDTSSPHPLLAEVTARAVTASKTSAVSAPKPKDALTTTLQDKGQMTQSRLNACIRECVAAVLHIAEADELDSSTPLSDLGMDSVMSTALRQRLRQTFSVKLPPTLLWTHPTIAKLSLWFSKS